MTDVETLVLLTILFGIVNLIVLIRIIDPKLDQLLNKEKS